MSAGSGVPGAPLESLLRGSRRALACLAAAASLFLPAPALAASLDPALKWTTAETDHFVVYWYQGEELAAQRLLQIAEPIHHKVTTALGWTPKSKTHVVLTDTTDTANGFAVAVPFNTIRLFVTAPQEGSSLENYDDWLTVLFTHELTHIVHIDKVGGMPSLLRGVFGSVIDPNQVEPRWIVEGLATYQETQLTSAGRGRASFAEMLIRAAVLADRFPPISRAGGDTEQWPGGYVPYIFGVQFWQHLRDRYGDAAIKEFTRRTGNEVFPFFPFYPRLNGHAKKAFGKSFYALWREWGQELRVRYNQEWERLSQSGLTPIERLTRHGGLVMAPRVSPDGKRVVYSSSNGQGPAAIRVMDVDGKNDKVLLEKYTADGFGWSPDSAVVAFGAEKLWQDFYLWSDIYTYSFDEKRVERKTRGARARTPEFKPDGTELVFVTNDVSNNDLATLKVDQSITWITNHTDWTQYSTPRWKPDGSVIAVSTWAQGGYRDVVLLDPKGKIVQRITADRAIDRDPTWTADGQYLLFSSDRTGIANLYAYQPSEGRYYQVTNLLHGAFQPSVTPDGAWIVFQGYDADGYDVYRTAFDPKTWREIGWTFDAEMFDATCKPPPGFQTRAPEDAGEEAEIAASNGTEPRPGSRSLPRPNPRPWDDPSDGVLAELASSKPERSYRGHPSDADAGTGTVATAIAAATAATATAAASSAADPAQEPVPDAREANENAAAKGGRPKNRPDKNAGVDLSNVPQKPFRPWKTLFPPRYWLPAQLYITESGLTVGAFTGGTDPLFRHGYSAWVNYNSAANFVGGGARYYNDRWRPTLYTGVDTYVVDYGQSLYELADFRESGNHLYNVHSTGEHYFEQRVVGQAGAYYYWRRKYFFSLRYLFDHRTAWTELNARTYDPFLPVAGNFAGPSFAVTLDRTEQYRWSISPAKGYRLSATVEALEPMFGSDYRKEIGTLETRAYLPVPVVKHSVLGLRAVASYAQGDDIRPNTFRLGGALGESALSFATPNYYSLRGFPFFAFGGERLLLASAEYRFPIWRVNRGIGTGPFYLRTLHGAVFADSGQAWNVDEEMSIDGFHTGVGAELRADTIWFYYFPITIRLGYAFAPTGDERGYPLGDPYGFVFTLGTSF